MTRAARYRSCIRPRCREQKIYSLNWRFERAHSWTSLCMISVITVNYYLISKHAIFLEQDVLVGRVAVNIRIIC